MSDRAVILARASSTKQAIQGDTLDDQLYQCNEFIKIKRWMVAKTFPLVESGREEERKYFKEVLNYCKDPKNNIQYIVAKNISRFTRKGSRDYYDVKAQMTLAGVKLRDIYGTIGNEVNTMEQFGLKYDWSTYSPTEGSEAREADKAKDYVRDTLTQMIGAEIQYTRLGFWNRRPPYGFRNQKIDTQCYGERNVLFPDPKESFFIIKMFALKSEGILDDLIIVEEINKLGYLSRERKRRDPRTKKVIGKTGQNYLTVKQFRKYIANPIYVGVICEKWTLYEPVGAKFKGLVDVDTYNKANFGKIAIAGPFEQPQIKYGKDLIDDKNKHIKRRLKINPLYPFKGAVLCPICNKNINGSASTGKSGIKYPGYHHSDGHKLWRVPKKEFEDSIYSYFSTIRFNSDFIKLFEATFLEVWKEKIADLYKESKLEEQYINNLLIKQSSTFESIKIARSPTVIKALETEYESLESQILLARQDLAIKEKNKLDFKQGIKYATYLMEHYQDLLIDSNNHVQKRQLFDLIFNKPPRYDEIVSGTPILSPLFALNTSQNAQKSSLVTLSVFNPHKIISDLVDLMNTFLPDLRRLELAC